MKIAIVGPGIMPIPPVGWGAVEILVWDIKNTLDELGHEVQIINTPNPKEIIDQINNFRPNFVHVQYDDFVEIIPYIQYPCAITSHFGYLEQPNKWDYYGPRVAQKFYEIKPRTFCLSSGIKEIYEKIMEFPSNKLFVTPNGVNEKVFDFTHKPNHPDRSIYLAKIDYRKRQYLFQTIDSLWYAGNIADSRFNANKNYLGEWSKDTLYKNLTHYGNLVLLSDGEAHPLVCMEALICGLGVVVSEFSTANLDVNEKFIDVIPEEKINDITYVESIILKNRQYSIAHRKEILEYAEQFKWKNIIKKYYIPSINEVIETYYDRI